MSTTKQRVPAVEGLFTMDAEQPALIGGKARTRGSYFFPKHLGGSDPLCVGDEIDEVLLSRRGKVWSWTTSSYPPPPPFIVQTEPYVPIVIAAFSDFTDSLAKLASHFPSRPMVYST